MDIMLWNASKIADKLKRNSISLPPPPPLTLPLPTPKGDGLKL